VAKERRQFSREFKLMALGRLETAGNVQLLAAELGVRRELLYDWREKFAAGGAEGLKNSGRPRPVAEAPETLAAEKRIAQLERKLGQQAFELDFFKGALRRIEASRRPNDGPGATASSPRSKR
jgi:transposase